MSEPERAPCDGEIAITSRNGVITIQATHEGVGQSIEVSVFNARKILAFLAFMLDLPLQKKAAERIRL